MDIDKQPGINFDNIILVNLEFSRSPEYMEKPELSTNFLANHIVIEKTKLIFELSLSVFEKTNKDLFNLSCKMVGYFSVDNNNPNLDLERFAENNAPALMLPYIREVLANTTMRSGLKPIILPPFNIVALVKQSKDQK